MSAAVGAAVLAPHPARADEHALQPLVDYLDTFASLDRHELAALALTLGVILFGVVTAIALLRTRWRTNQALAARQGEINDLREERDRAVALLHLRAAGDRGVARRRR